MNRLTCEICGSNDLIKEEGCFVCQGCGTKYSVEEAKKMLAEVNDEKTKEHTKSNSLSKIEKWINISINSFIGGDYTNTINYANKVLENEQDEVMDFIALETRKLKQAKKRKIYEYDMADILGRLLEKDILSIDNYYKYQKLIRYMASYLGWYTSEFLNDKYINDGTIEKFINKCRDIEVLRSWYYKIENELQKMIESLKEILNKYNTSNDIINNSDNSEMQDIVTKGRIILRDCKLIDELRTIAENNNIDLESNYQIDESFVNELKNLAKNCEEAIDKNNEKKKNGCYIATCVYGSYDCSEVWVLRRFRDYYLNNHFIGKQFIMLYYTFSPTIVKIFGKYDIFKCFNKIWLDKVVNYLKSKGYSSVKYKDIEENLK